MTRALLVCAIILAASCAGEPAGPEAIALGQDACAQCRMVIVSQATAAQIVAAGEVPRFFDDIGCLRDHLTAGGPAAGLRVYVADHRTGDWIDASQATFTRTSVSTPMASGLVAHTDAASRDGDPAARQGEPVAAEAILGPATRRVGP